mmetsp:Transcript_19967/g.55494  ORF Transcript_19967/g.55494 Transcript_19967/m.55494 type:complete len:212 (+) Transcript_19967:104-739(+)|eukprot:CAMPEP_0117667144 /NCGR_PEP_ID=MMETSP0804-20121206/10790_1 /TAXON_ID=1074897 /ORGANISM="Tetraselmis astigmatica, Strain CCMP880" /LENGTH=211 /DNA_ID=CAMNT_0005474811 /DNA_START=37 /DNA_END=672 /DNA_ORIENTATION=-
MTSSTNKRARRLRLLRSYISMLGGAFRRSCNALARGRVLKAHKRLAQTVSGTVAGHRLSLSDKALQTAQKQQAFARLSCRLKPMRIAPPRDATSSGAERSARARRPFSVTSLPPESLHLSAFTDARSFLAESGDKAFSASAYDDDMAPADDSATAAKKAASQEKIDKLFAAQAAKRAASLQAKAQPSHVLSRQGSMAAPSRQNSMAPLRQA